VALERVGAQCRAQLRHQGGGCHAAADDVADRQRNVPAGELEDVVPVAAQSRAGRRGPVARRQLDACDLRQL
jgi:hypothetical protein